MSDFFDLRKKILGIDKKIPLLNGEMVQYVNLDNAASTPPLVEVMNALNDFMPYYSSVHRGSGFKSRLSTLAYDQAHEIIARFVGANPETNTVIFGKNTTEAINKLSYRFPMKDDSIVMTTAMEHHSNDLPWRRRGNVLHVNVLPDGRLDENDFDAKLEKYGSQIALVTVTGASNVTGYIQPVHRLARKAHAVGAKIMVDAAQLAPHRKVDMRPDDDPEHLDFVVIAGHKMYAPFGTGALIGPKEIFESGDPEYPGGGTVSVVTLDEVHWAGAPDRDEAGSPNVPGAVAIATAAKVLMEVGMDKVAAHEEELIAYTLEKFKSMPYISVYGITDPEKSGEKVGAIPFNVDGVSHFLAAAVLGYEGGIGVRSGCFCAHPYVIHMLGLSNAEIQAWREQFLAGDKSNMPGLLRMSFGCYNNTDDVDRLLDMLPVLHNSTFKGNYVCEEGTGEFFPVDYKDNFKPWFQLDDHVPEHRPKSGCGVNS